MTQLKGKIVWITGASSGIGEALALQASDSDARLILTARRAEELERVRAACRRLDRTAVLPLDLTAFDAEAARAKAESFFGPVDILVNNAGVSQRASVLQTSMDVYRRILELDFFAPVALTKAVLPGMIERRSGHVVMVSSVVGHVGTPRRSAYAAAKHAVQGFCDALRAEIWRSGVKVTVVCPGYVRTNISRNALTGSGQAHGVMDRGQQRGMDPGLCALKIWRAVERDEDEVVIGIEGLAILAKRLAPKAVSYVLKRVKVV